MTTAVVKTSEATGIATDQLVGDFNSIAADPVAAISKLNDQYHFLTLATYNQIKALQEEGNQQEAARVASEAYSSSLIQRSNQIKENLGTLERAWNSLGEMAGKAWNAMLNVGRESSVEQKIQQTQDMLDRARSDLANMQKGGSVDTGNYGYGRQSDSLGAQQSRQRSKDQETLVSNLEKQLSLLQGEEISQNLINGLVDDRNRKEQEHIKIQQDADRVNQQFLSNADKRNKAIEQQKKFWTPAQSARNGTRKISRASMKCIKTQKRRAPKGKAVTEDAGQRMIDQLNQQNALLVTQAEATNKLSSSEQELIKWRQQLSSLETRSPSQLTTAQKSLLLRKDEITSLMERNAQQEKNNRLMKEATELASYRSTLEMGLDNLRASYAVQDSGFGLGEKQQKQTQELLQLEQKYNTQRQQLDRDYADKSKGMSEETYNAKSQMLTDALGRERAIMQQHYENLDAMNNDWLGGVEQGFETGWIQHRHILPRCLALFRSDEWSCRHDGRWVKR